jgi:LuxR family maltose regulon positive regulatory protein
VTPVARERLWTALDRAAERPLTVIVGPPGAGKTALLESWIAAGRAPGPVTWLAPGRTVANAAPGVLVIDDFHMAPATVHSDLGLLLRHPDPELRVIVATRADPPLQLARLRVQDQLAEIRAAELAFTLDETADLVGGDAQRVWERTEGWVGAVCGSHDQLLAEVLAGLRLQDRRFVMRTAIAGVLNGDLADALTGGRDGHRRLASLARTCTLVEPLDRRNEWFRYHPLLADWLRAQLPSEECVAIHRSAAVWHADRGDDARALRHAGDAGDRDLAEQLAHERWIGLLIRGEIAAVAPLADAGRPPLALAALLLERGDAGAAERHMRDAEPGVALAALSLHVARLRGDVEALRTAAVADLEGAGTDVRALAVTNLGIAELWLGDADAATLHLERGKLAAEEAGGSWLALVARAHLALAACGRDDFARAALHAADAIALAEEHGWTASWPAGVAQLALTAVELLNRRIDAAERWLARAEESLAGTPEPPLHAVLAVLRSGVLEARGDRERALAVVVAARAALAGWPLRRSLHDDLEAREAALRAALGDRRGAERLLARAGSLTAAVLLAQLRLADGEHEAARAIIAPWLPTLDGERALPSVQAHVVDALTLDAAADHAGAAAVLERALARAEPYGLRAALLAFGAPLLPLVRRQLRRGTAHAALARDVAAALAGDGRPVALASAGAVEPLSPRERAVLRYLPTTLSNQGIAAELCVSVNTIKTHLKAIYRKLGVEDRQAAVTRARAQKLLTPGG